MNILKYFYLITSALLALAFGLAAYFYLFIIPFPNNSVIVQPNGGLGNQMFQYAAAYSLARKTGGKLFVLVDKKEEEKGMQSSSDRNFTLGIFKNIPKEQIVYTKDLNKNFVKKNNLFYNLGGRSDHSSLRKKMKKYFNITYVDNDSFFDHYDKNNNKVLFVNDYFESELYFKEFKDEVIKIFNLDDKINADLQSKIDLVSGYNSFCVHVRKGDMLRTGYLYHLPIDYQKLAISFAKDLTDNPKFYFFSDSSEILKQEFSLIKNSNIINGTPIDDFIVMSHCANNIIANSTFSWWASYLNKKTDRYVIAPFPRRNDYFYQNIFEDDNLRYQARILAKNNSYPENWISLEYDVFKPNEFIKHSFVNSDKKQEILESYIFKKYNLYSGNLIQLDICKGKNEFNKNICFLNKEYAQQKPTIVTALYDIKNQPTNIDNLRKFLKTPSNLVIFTDKKHLELVKTLRGNLPVKIIEKEFDQLFYYKFYDNYKIMYKLDDNNQKTHSPEFYIHQVSKASMVSQATDLNPYNSLFYVWADIDLGESLADIDDTKMIQDKISVLALEDYNVLDHANMLAGNDDVRIDTKLIIGDKTSWKILDVLWNKTVLDLMKDYISIRSDAAILGTVYLRNKNFINLIYPPMGYRNDLKEFLLQYYSTKEHLEKEEEE